MFNTMLSILFLVISPSLVLSLQCYRCPASIKLNYTVTSETIPSFSSRCELVNASTCSVDIFWDLKANTSVIDVDITGGLKGRDVIPNTLGVALLMAVRSDNITDAWQQAVYYDTTLIEKGNDENNLQKFLRSLTIEDKFQQEIAPLIQIVPSFDPKTANCLEFKHDVFECPGKDLNTCSRCLISINQTTSDQSVCATCPFASDAENTVVRYKTFFLNNRTIDSDVTYLTCQLKECNSFENINRIQQASKITFNFDEYFKN